MRGSRSRTVGLVAGLVAVGAALVACTGSASSETAEVDPSRVGPQGRVAQFVVACAVSHIAYDDPIVLPDRPGLSHQHQFFGNSSTTSDPDYERMLGAETSCDQRLDTASYWSPTLLAADGSRIGADELTAYYRPGDGVDPRAVVAYPPGFMMVAGDASADAAQDRDVVAWSCGTGALRSDTPPPCPTGTSLRLWITFPDCWDESRLTSLGTGDHVRYSDGGCPDTHPVALPQLQMAIDYPAVDPEGLTLSSGDVQTAHADFWNTWDQAKLEREVRGCINRDVVCGLSS